MKTSRLTPAQLKKLYRFCQSSTLNITQFAKSIGITRNTLKRYLKLLRDAEIANRQGFISEKTFCQLQSKKLPANQAVSCLYKLLPELIAAQPGRSNIKQLWLSYRLQQPGGYAYSQFALRYSEWRNTTTGLDISGFFLPSADVEVLQQWRRSNDRRHWERAVLLLDAANGTAISKLAEKIERTPESLRAWLNAYRKNGLPGLQQKNRSNKAEVARQIATKKENLVRLLHEAPQLHGFNRTSWRLKDLSTAYLETYQSSLSIAMISLYIRQEGYVFRKARKVLTSPDPEFRQKLTKIQTILGSLQPDEKFFSIDEYGPFSVKMKGGRALVKRGESKTYPQFQPSKGCLICTAALELSTNQMTHFYSRKKNTDEMIKLIDLLCGRYHDQHKLYLSWDAAIWHASKKLNTYINGINAAAYQAEHHTPLVELAPLPASAQFLNVIESVFSGLAKSVIHHSDYASVGHCQAAIDRYFRERNQHFALHPKKAGKKIWGQERTVAEFRDSHNCKDPAWR